MSENNKDEKASGRGPSPDALKAAYQTAASAAAGVRSTWLGVKAAARLRAWREAVKDARGIPVTSPAAVTR
jgi:hypothetical protein